jgi:alkanesulfonate monooxygenase SsuD/methylene tetrahydromethanopterin reductase-like flavin-dependent oxidoreductase (luciferase family)
MRSGFILPAGTADRQLPQAVAAEEAGWDAVFVWESAYGVDAWSLLSGIAARTSRVMLGTVLTPLPWRRPWKLASQVATLDQLSAGRAMVTVGLGAIDSGMPAAGELADKRERAALMDEGIDLMRALWAGQPNYAGEHFRIHCPDWLLEAARPVQERIPIWVAAAWPRPKSMTRALRCDGVLPEWHLSGREGGPDDVRAMRAWLAEHGSPGLDVIAEGETPADDETTAAAQLQPWADAGCTWWLETRWGSEDSVDERLRRVDERIAAGPPRAATTAG